MPGGRSERTRGLAAKAGIKDVPTYGDLIRETGMILSIMVPGEAVNTARKVADALRDSGESTIYVDLNAIAPATGREIDGVIRSLTRSLGRRFPGSPQRAGKSTG